MDQNEQKSPVDLSHTEERVVSERRSIPDALVSTQGTSFLKQTSNRFQC